MIRKTSCLLCMLIFVAVVNASDGMGFVEVTSHRTNMDVEKITLHDAAWETIAPYRQPLQRQFLVDPKPEKVGVEEMFVQSVHDARFISFRLTWKDATLDETPRIMGFSDGAALQFPVNQGVFPEHFMGDVNNSVHILYWKAWSSRDEKSGFQTVESSYPNMTADVHTFDYPVEGAATEKSQAEKDFFIPGKAAGNPLSFPSPEVITELASTGPGTITPKGTNNTSGAAEWREGVWTVIFTRPLVVDDKGSVQFTVGEKIPVAFAVWEGSHLEAGSRKAVSPAWAEVEIQK